MRQERRCFQHGRSRRAGRPPTAGGTPAFLAAVRCTPGQLIIEPRFTRRKLIFAMLRNKRDRNPPKKHGNIPL
jgi:hypothetical protein